MKKSLICLVCLLLALCAPAFSAMAGAEPEASVMALSDGGVSVYIGENNAVCEAGASQPLFDGPAASIQYADQSVIVFTTVDESGVGLYAAPRNLYSLALRGDAGPRLIAAAGNECVYVPRDGLVYFIDQQEDSELRGYNPLTGSCAKVCSLASEVQALRASIDGLLLSTAGGDLLLVPATGELINAPVQTQGVTVQVFDRFETLLAADGTLSLRGVAQGMADAQQIGTDVRCVTALNGIVYFLRGEADGAQLYEYDYSTKATTAIGQFKSAMFPMMAAADGRVFMMAQDGRVFSLSADSSSVSVFAHFPTTDKDPLMAVSGDDLLVYDASAPDGVPRFVAAYPLNGEALPTIEPADPAATAEPADPAAKPQGDGPRTLSRGLRGGDVRELQQILRAQGYPAGTPDGIYGAGTASAVRYLQYDMGVKETGSVTPEFMEALREKKLPSYARYVEMRKGDRGCRVYDMQQRLHALGWLGRKADGDYGSNTAEAVRAAEKALGEKGSGVATVKFLEHLFKKDMLKNPATDDAEPTGASIRHDPEISEDDLIGLCRFLNDRFPGGNYDVKRAVYKLQSRLVDMGYLKKSQRSRIYDADTFLAVKRVQNENDLLAHPTGKPDNKTLEFIFPENQRAW